MINVKTAFAVAGDGITDDTAAINAAIAAHAGTYVRVLNFPNGIYLVSDTITPGTLVSKAKGLTLQGQIQADTIIRLKDDAAGFTTPGTPKPMISSYTGTATNNQAFGNNIFNLTIDTGIGNSGANALRYLTNNYGSIRDVTVRSSDPNRVGQNGIVMGKAWPGPSMPRNVTVDGSVPFNQSEILHDALVRAGASVTFFPQKMLGHGGSGWSNAPVVDPMHAFLDRVLKGANANALPVPRFTVNAATVAAGTTVNFNVGTSTAAAGSIARYAWSFGDNKADEGAQVSFRYTKPGTYRVTLCVEDDAHGCASTSQLITVTPPGVNATPLIVALTDPPDGTTLLETAAVHLAADATATGATVSLVEFLVNDVPRGHDSTRLSD